VVPAFALSGYELVLVVWGVCWMALGTGMMYLIHRVMAAEEQQVERAGSAPVAQVGDQASEPGRKIAA
jgi:hypothetical protein